MPFYKKFAKSSPIFSGSTLVILPLVS